MSYTKREVSDISRAFKQSLGLSPDASLPEQPPMQITLNLRATAHATLMEIASYREAIPEEIAERVLASRLKTLAARIHRKQPSLDRFNARRKAAADPTAA
jgi:hypothetical protein